jgi:hypothetical protein
MKLATKCIFPLFILFDAKGEWGSITLDNHRGGDVSIRMKYQGVHTGQKAYIKWALIDMDTKETIRTLYINGDSNTTHTWANIPAGDYTLRWESLNGYKVDGWYSATIVGGSIYNNYTGIKNPF